MYKIRPIVENVEVEYPTCMYKVKNIIEHDEIPIKSGVSLRTTSTRVTTNSTLPNPLDLRIFEQIQNILKV